MTTVRFAVSPGTRFEIEMRDAAALLSLLADSVADPNELPGLSVVAVKLALDLSAETVRPISTRAERAMPARRTAGLRIRLFPFSPPRCFSVSGGCDMGNYLFSAGSLHPAVGGDFVVRWYYAPRGRTTRARPNG